MSDILILVIVDIPVVGKPKAKAKLYFTNQPVPDPLDVRIGDRIGWFVQVGTNQGRSPLPYKVSFQSETSADDAFFGVSSLTVPHGGSSPFLPVKGLKGRTKYSVEVTGLGTVLDPDIQTGSDIIFSIAAAHSDFEVTWDLDNNTMSCQKDGSPQPFPIPVSAGDSVTFQPASAYPLPCIEIVFPAGQNSGNSWVSPFDPEKGTFSAAGGPGPVGPLKVTDTFDSGNTFIFHALTEDGHLTSADFAITIA